MSKKQRTLPDCETLRHWFDYDPETGVVTWRRSKQGHTRAGSVAGRIDRAGRRYIKFGQIRIAAYRLIWCWMTGGWPKLELDHKDGNPSNDRWDNLREATSSQNKANTRRHMDNRSGYKGVSKSGSKWQAEICVNRKRIKLGLFETAEEGYRAYCEAARQHFGVFGCTGRRVAEENAEKV